jgi:hypothetical protein
MCRVGKKFDPLKKGLAQELIEGYGQQKPLAHPSVVSEATAEEKLVASSESARSLLIQHHVDFVSIVYVYTSIVMRRWRTSRKGISL